MVDRSTDLAHASAADPSAPPAVTLLRWIERSRQVEDRLRSLYRQGRVAGGVYLGIGQEALAASCGMALQPGDLYAPLIRDMAGRLAFGEPMAEPFKVYLGKRTGSMRGRDGNIHRGDLDAGQLPMISHLGAMLPTVSGMLLARRLRDSANASNTSIGIAVSGDGGTNTGAFHEGLNAAAVLRLPLVVVVANNRYSYSTPNDESFACEHLIDRAVGYGIRGERIDGTDPAACLAAVTSAVDRARAGEGVQLVVADLLRLSGHGEHDDATYVSEEEKRTSRDCLVVAREQAVAAGLLDQAACDALAAAVTTEVDEALAAAEAAPDAAPESETWQAWSQDWPGLRAWGRAVGDTYGTGVG